MLCPEFDVAAPETAEATLALVHFAGVLGADRLMGEVTQAGRREEPVAANERAGRREERRELLAPILGWFTEGYDTADLTEARSILEALKLTAGRGHLWVHAVDFLITFEGPLSRVSPVPSRPAEGPVAKPIAVA
jgi:hypothetical protein